MSFRKFQESAAARRWVQVVLGGIAVIFVVGAFWSFGSPAQMRRPMPDKVAMRVNGQEIRESELNRAVEWQRESGGLRGIATYFNSLYWSMQGLVRQTVIAQEAQRLGIVATKDEIEAKRNEYREQQLRLAGEGTDQKRFLVERDMTWREYEDDVSKRAKAMRETFRNQIIYDKLQEAVTQDVHVTDDELLARYRKFTVSHVLVRVGTQRDRENWEAEQEAKRDSKEGEAESAAPTESSSEVTPESTAKSESSADAEEPRPAWLDRTEEDAERIALEVRKRIAEGGESFEDVAREVSDDTESAAKGGSLGELDYQDLQRMVPEFREAVYGLGAGEISEPVKTQFGYHVIRVESVEESNLPPDFENQKEDMRQTALKSKQAQAFNEHIQQLVDQAHVEVEDLRAKIAWLLYHRREERSRIEEEVALAEATEGLRKLIADERKQAHDAGAASFEFLAPYYYQLGSIYSQQGRWSEALEEFRQANEAEPVPEAQIAVGRCLVKLGRKAEALPVLAEVAQRATPVAKFLMIHEELSSLYFELGEAKLGMAQHEKVQKAQQAAGPYGGMDFPLDLGM